MFVNIFKNRKSSNIIKKNDENQQVQYLTAKELSIRKFKKNKAAVISLIFLIIIYIVVLFAEFVSPYEYNTRVKECSYTPPQKVHFITEKGKITTPFTYQLTSKRNLETFMYEYEEDKTRINKIKFFAHGDTYKLFGVIKLDVHLLSVDKGGHMFLLGTDILGRDVLSRIIMGGRVSLTVGLVGVLLTIFFGALMGTLSGYFGGWIDTVIQRIIEFIRAFPQLPLWMALTAALPPEWPSQYVYFGIVTILAFIGWTSLAREIRGKVLAFRNTDFILAAETMGASSKRIIFRYMIPNMISHIMVVATLSIPGMILGESALSYLGLGIKAPMTSWGLMMAEAQKVEVMKNYPWMMLSGLFIFVVILAFNFLGDGLRDSVDPFSN